MDSGLCLLYVPHTTGAVTINESADPSVKEDILMVLNRIVPWKAEYRHLEGNSPAHVKATLVGASEPIAIEDGRLALGTWQGIFFCEFDGPRTRKLRIHILRGDLNADDDHGRCRPGHSKPDPVPLPDLPPGPI